MDDWLTIPGDRKSLPAGRLCVIMALTVLLLVVAQVPKGRPSPDAGPALPMR